MVLVVAARSIRDHVLHAYAGRDTCPPNTPCKSDGVSPSTDPSQSKSQGSDDSHELGSDVKGYIGVAVVCGLILIGLVLWLTLANYPRRKMRQWMDRARGEPCIEEGSVAELDLKGERSRNGTTTPSSDDRRTSLTSSPIPPLLPTAPKAKGEAKGDKGELPERAVDTVHKVRRAYYL